MPIMVTTSADEANSKESEEQLSSACERQTESEETPELCFRRVDRRIRSVLQHNKHLPTVSGLLSLNFLETYMR